MRALPLLLLLAPLSALAQNDHAQQCQSVTSLPLPQEADVSKPIVFPACEAYKSYAGIGRPVNYAAARACAWKERAAQQANLPQNQEASIAWAIGGDLILVNLYANGLGVPRNAPLALHLACEENSGIAGDTISDLDKFSKTTQLSAKRFDVCDFAYSTFDMNFCVSYQNEIAAERRSRAIRRLSAQWTPEQKSAFAKVEATEREYVSAHSYELDQGGSIHNLRDMGSAEIMHNNFLLDLRQFERGNTPKKIDAAKAENAMTKQYETNLTAAQAPVTSSTSATDVTSEGVAKVQTAWTHYRHTWLAFAALRYPSVPATTFRAYFAEERLRLLAAMRNEINRD